MLLVSSLAGGVEKAATVDDVIHESISLGLVDQRKPPAR
jgi:hypothetical protein